MEIPERGLNLPEVPVSRRICTSDPKLETLLFLQLPGYVYIFVACLVGERGEGLTSCSRSLTSASWFPRLPRREFGEYLKYDYRKEGQG